MVNLPRRLGGTLASLSDYGCYPIFYVVKDGGALCAACANEAEAEHKVDEEEGYTPGPEGTIVGADTNDENPALHCDECGERIPSAYAEDLVPMLADAWAREGGTVPEGSDGPVNLDSLDLGDASILSDHLPDGLAEYARLRWRADHDRRNGRIEEALAIEATMEGIYDSLPDIHRW